MSDGAKDTTETPTAPAEVTRTGRRWRKWLVVVLVFLTCLSILVSTIGVWAHRTLLNTDSWVNAVGPLASNPEVTDAVAKEVTTQVMSVIDAEQVAENALPDQAQFLAAPLSEAVGQFVNRTVAELLQTEQFQEFWVAANRKVHPIVVKVLRGETKGVLTADGQVQLNLLPLVADALQFVQSKAPGLVGNGNPIPDVTLDTPPDEARQELASAVGRTVPENFGVVDVFQSDKLKAAQDAVELFDRLVVVFLVVTLLLLVATIALAPNRRNAVIALALGTVVAFALAVAIVGAIRGQVLDLITDPTSRDAADQTVRTLVGRLRLLVNWIMAIGLAVALIAFLTGGSRLAVGIRRGASRGVGYLGGKVDREGAPGALIWVQDHVVELRWGGLVVGLLVLLFLVNGWWGLFLTVLLVGLFEAALSFAAARRSEGTGPPAGSATA